MVRKKHRPATLHLQPKRTITEKEKSEKSKGENDEKANENIHSLARKMNLEDTNSREQEAEEIYKETKCGPSKPSSRTCVVNSNCFGTSITIVWLKMLKEYIR